MNKKGTKVQLAGKFLNAKSWKILCLTFIFIIGLGCPLYSEDETKANRVKTKKEVEKVKVGAEKENQDQKWTRIKPSDGKKTVTANRSSDSTEKKDFDPNKLSVPLKATEWKNIKSIKKEKTRPSPKNNDALEKAMAAVEKRWKKVEKKKFVASKRTNSKSPSQKIKELEAIIKKLQKKNRTAKKTGATYTDLPSPDYLENRIAYRSSESINKTISPILGTVMQEFYKLNKIDESLNGNVVLSFKIKNTGEIFWLKVSYSTLKNKNFMNYVLEEFKKCNFKPVDPKTKPVSMVYPLIFKPLDD